jgi:serine/threonine protein kinase
MLLLDGTELLRLYCVPVSILNLLIYGPLVVFLQSYWEDSPYSQVLNMFIKGDHYLDQIQKIISVLGSPSNEELEFITNPQAKEFVGKLAKRTKQSFSQLFPKSNPVALDLLAKMLIFNPYKRYTIEQCISHPYFEGLHNPEEEPISESSFDWSFDDIELTKENLQKLIYEESLCFHSDNE